MDYKQVLEDLYREIKEDRSGQVATYIPELSKVNPDKFAVYLCCNDGHESATGHYRDKFSIQSISKVFALTMAYRQLGKKLWQRVGVEPSGTPFNSLVQLEYDQGIPRNPFINAGALVVCDILLSEYAQAESMLLNFVRKLANDTSINISERIALSEKASGYRNAAMAYLIKSFGNINNEVDKVLDFYYRLCAIEMNVKQVSYAFRFLANNGIEPQSGETIVNSSRAKRINAVMQLCGLYDEAGEFSFKVGLPGKSGVGGGIAAVHPGKYSIAVWSPRLNEKGNSTLGLRFLEGFTSKTEMSIF